MGDILGDLGRIAIGVMNPPLGAYELLNGGRLPWESAPADDTAGPACPDTGAPQPGVDAGSTDGGGEDTSAGTTPLPGYQRVSDPGGAGLVDVLRQVAPANQVDAFQGATDNRSRWSAAQGLADALRGVQEDVGNQVQVPGDSPADAATRARIIAGELGDISSAQRALRHIANTGGMAPGTDAGTVGALAAEALDVFDQNGDGNLDSSESRYYGPRSGVSGGDVGDASKLVSYADADGDGVATGDEVRAFVQYFDSDGDGRIDDYERGTYADYAPQWEHTGGSATLDPNDFGGTGTGTGLGQAADGAASARPHPGTPEADDWSSDSATNAPAPAEEWSDPAAGDSPAADPLSPLPQGQPGAP